MLTVFAILLAGIGTGRLLYGRRLVFLSPLITAVIWLLLFLLGVEAGSDPAVVGGLTTLGATAFVIFALSVAGSILASWALWRWIRRRPATRVPASGTASPEQGERPVPLWEDALRPDVDTIDFDIACGSARPLTWRIETDCPWLRFSARGGVTGGTARVTLTVDELTKKFKTQLTLCERLANDKQDPRFIQSAYITYEDEVKAK